MLHRLFAVAVVGCTLLLGVVAVPDGLAAEATPVFDSKLISPSTPGHAVSVDVDVTGAKELYLVVRDGGDGFGCDWAAWAEPRLIGPSGETKLTELKWKSATSGYGDAKVNANCNGGPIKIAGQSALYGIGAHANSVIAYDLPAGITRFTARAGLDDQGTSQGCGSTVQFLVYTQAPPTSIANPSRADAGGSHELVDAISGLDVAPGLAVSLMAGEPMLLSPSNIDVDHLGRVWVCEVVNYRQFANKANLGRPEGDRILVLEDTNGDGLMDKSTTFYQGRDVDSAHGVCVLGDRVIISAGDSVFSLYDRNGDLKADPGSKEFLFTGISGTQHDHGIHAFVFGPDGKLYFNFGNSGKQLKDKDGKPIIDKAGNEINDSRKPYQEGMVFRCNLDGSEVETLGWNFRNNWEVCVDSFGTMWQSDNDDDGNRGVRINYVMEYGNYGYKDELTGAGWQSPRTNMESEIPLRHWHLNDPGVVPNVLQTGAGSPTGICVYEGDLLPEIFRNQIIHCDAGPNIVRAYIMKPDGAGYKAEIVNILEGTRDKWFRPSDVCVAPDGSLVIADWYDPGVGGHRQGDIDKGRLFRVAPPGVKYTVPKVDVSTVEGAIKALKSPNQATRYLAWMSLHQRGAKALSSIEKLAFEEPNARLRVRGLWLISKLPESAGLFHAKIAIDSERSKDCRVAMFRALRQMRNLDEREFLTAFSDEFKNAPPALLRELLLCARQMQGERRSVFWSELAAIYVANGVEDRWMLEAFGIAARDEDGWNKCLKRFLASRTNTPDKKLVRDIIWRSRATQTPELLAKIISDPDTPADELPRYFRAFDFLTGEKKDAAIKQLAFSPSSGDEARQAIILIESLNRVPGFDVSKNPQQLAALNKVLDQSQGTVQFLTLIDRFQLKDRYQDVIAILQSQPDSSLAIEAVKLLMAKEHRQLLSAALADADPLKAAAVARALGNSGDNRTTPFLIDAMANEKAALAVRMAATKGLGRSKQGVRQLLELAKAKKIPADLEPAAAFALSAQTFEEFKTEIAAIYPPAPSRNDQPIPPLSDLLKSKGDVNRGKAIFATVGKCNTCHIVNGEGKEVGPNLSEIGSKLSREAMFESILYPSAGISHNYETWTAVTDSGSVISGIKVSETDTELVLRGSDALTRTLKKSELEEVKKQPTSLMPADLQKTMTVQELIDVVEFSQSLKKK